ncbi:signal peptidase I [Streptomyces sp. NPDC002851]
MRSAGAMLVHVPGRYRDQPVVKRVIGIGGDRVACCDAGRVTVHGKPLDEPYLLDGGTGQGSSTYDDYDVRVPEGRLFLLGDNRANSRDSRSFLNEQSGTFAASGVRGRVTDSGSRLEAP